MVNRENKRDEWDQFSSAFYENFFNSICLSANYLMKTILFVASHTYRCHVDVWSVAIFCIYFLVLKSIILVQRIQGRKTTWWELIIYIKYIALFFVQPPPLNLQTVQAPLFRQFLPIYCFFLWPPFQSTYIISKFFIFNPHPIF